MSNVLKKKKAPERLMWDHIFPAPMAELYKMVSGSDFFVEGMKKMCEASLGNGLYSSLVFMAAQVYMERLRASGLMLVAPRDSIPRACRVFAAPEVSEAEARGWFVVLVYYNVVLARDEASCFYIDDEGVELVRLCSNSEMSRAIELFNEDASETAGGEVPWSAQA